MTTMTQPAPARITVGVDTHAEVQVAVANDSLGRRLGATSVATTPAGYAELLGWARRLGQVEGWGMEGTGSFGAGLTRFLRALASWSWRSTAPTARPGAGAASPTRGRRGRRPSRPGHQGAVPKAGEGRWR